jgi:dinuclear metal center YbgI/SA1388 family protein
VTTVADVVAVLQRHYPESLAESWDRVGLAVGSRGATVSRILYTVDVTLEVVEEAVSRGADLIVAHHPLLLRGVHAVDLDHPKGRILAELVRNGIALYVAHTNADLPPGGVVDSLATALGLTGARPLRPAPGAGADTGLGRVGSVDGELTLGDFVQRVAQVLPATGGGIRVSGDLDRPVAVVAVQAGAGDDLLDAAREAGADVYLTSDLRHHPASEARAWPGAPALVDVSHWAAESLWLPVCARAVATGLDAAGMTVPADTSTVRTDAWDHHV